MGSVGKTKSNQSMKPEAQAEIEKRLDLLKCYFDFLTDPKREYSNYEFARQRIIYNCKRLTEIVNKM